ncbi:MAG: UvrD-helicase domain-containing protein [Bacteroidales bacterium]|nr:UvrD-helicase domain-containing protein [Bacteroidales bacterium]
MIEILKASAGSGKTYNLAKKYIMLLLDSDDPHAFRHILAVTFTNKATDEMKSRIVKELFVLASAASESGYFKELMTLEKEGIKRWDSASALEKNAHRVLCDILHDYGAFSVSTIDRFFQQTLKSFAREVGQFASYQIELDRDALIDETVDSMLDSLELTDGKLLGWLTENAISNLQDGGRFKLEEPLYAFARRYKSSEYLSKKEKLGIREDEVFSEENLRTLRKKCTAIIVPFEKEVRAAAEEIVRQFGIAGVDPGQSKIGQVRSFLKFGIGAEADLTPNKSLRDAVVNGSYFAKTKAHLEQKLSGMLDRPVADLVGLFDDTDRYSLYRTALELRSQIGNFGIARRFNEEFKALTKEKNVLCLEDSNTILRDLIDGTDTPFVYEKTGVRYNSFLLDEFQDTSLVQWDNFRPLLENSMAEGAYNLIVGDVKQSIYRWRNSDWHLMHEGVKKDLGSAGIKDDEPLLSNWRSGANIVRLNNNLFHHASREIADKVCGGDSRVADIYTDVVQTPARSTIALGLVRFSWTDKEGASVEDHLVASVRLALGTGMRYSDIAVLVRGHKEGTKIATALIREGVPVVTDDSLRIQGALSVKRVIAMMSSIDNPSDTAACYLASEYSLPEDLGYNSLSDLCEELFRLLRIHDKEAFDADVLYNLAFMDMIRDYSSRKGNGLHAFLAWLKEKSVASKCISSPSRTNAVRIITVHKSKGLDFRYVIIPFVDAFGFFRSNSSWCCPDLEGTSFAVDDQSGGGIPKAVYDVPLSARLRGSLFEKDYEEEAVMQAIDVTNLVYVAMTRAVEGLHVIAEPLGNTFLESLRKGKPEYKNFSQLLWWYVNDCTRTHSDGAGNFDERMHVSVVPYEDAALGGTHFLAVTPESLRIEGLANRLEDALKGSYTAVPVPEQAEDISSPLPLSYESYDINGPEMVLDEYGELMDVRVRSRLKFSTDAVDFFSDDGETGVAASKRIRGIVLHDILSRVDSEAELEASVRQAEDAGLLAPGQAIEALVLLKTRLESVRDLGWFGEGKTLRERGIMDTDGTIHRPDRAVLAPDGSVKVIDFKFGKVHAGYASQVARYCALFRRMGYSRVEGFLWYIDTGEIVESVKYFAES